MGDIEKGEVQPKGHAAAVKEAIEDHKKGHHPHVSTPSAPAAAHVEQPFQGNGGAIA